MARFAGDLEQLADALCLERLSLVGVSAGGPFALACARAMPDRVSVAAAVSSVPPGLAPHSAAGTLLRYRYPLKALVHAPAFCASFADRVLAMVRERPGLIARFLSTAATDGDDTSLADGGALDAAVRRVQTAIERGAGPSIHDYLVVTRPWGSVFALRHSGRYLLVNPVRSSSCSASRARSRASRSAAAARSSCSLAFVAWRSAARRRLARSSWWRAARSSRSQVPARSCSAQNSLKRSWRSSRRASR